MPWNEHDLARLLASRHGVVTLPMLRSIGMSEANVRTQVRRGRLVRETRRVFFSPATPPTDLRDAALACAATDGCISFEWSGRLWSFRKMPPTARRVTVRADQRPTWPYVQVVRTNDLPDGDIVVRPDGIRLTSPPRTVWDAAGFLGPDDLASVIEQGLDRRMFTVPTLWAVARRLAAPGRLGSRRFVDVLGSRPSWTRPADSDLELVVERALAAIGLPPPVRQHPLVIAPGTTIHVDLAFPEVRLAVEVDHVSWHGGRLESAADKQRDRRVAGAGWLTSRVSDTDVRQRLWITAAEIAAIYRQRRG